MKSLLRLALLASVAIAIAGCDPPETPEPPEPIIQKRVNVFDFGSVECSKLTITERELDVLLSKGLMIRGEREKLDLDVDLDAAPYKGSCFGSIYILEGKKSLIDSIQYNSINY